MSFVQIIEMRSSKFAELQELGDEWERAPEAKRTVRRRVLCEDRDNPGRHFNIVFFDSYASAMENSALAETTDLSAKMEALLDAPPIFVNLDVLEERG